MKGSSKLIVALDLPTLNEARGYLDEVGDLLPFIKIGPVLFFQGGRSFLEEIMARGHRVFLDLKLHDIPNTVALGVEALADMGLWALTVHTGGGRAMMEAAAKAKGEMMLLGVTVLTSLNDRQWDEVHPRCSMTEALEARARSADKAGLDGIVCSPRDLSALRPLTSLLTIVPGIRPVQGGDDQARTASPRAAVAGGADYLVVGRPLLFAQDRRLAIEAIVNEIEEGLS
ncbi:MAG: orotidine-5'-phosphate decarboxylase [Synergistaceae bacterium]|jgi:orotidine-5'-phosphate decarboxylase|nr:orotidine-5'-phosphate decarboxylase [Synergistaceae bacterium]